jgi:phenylalanyl-tRNA synthetase beta chain
MNISTSWLREWSDPNVSDIDLAEKLTMAGLEVDKIGPVAPDFEGVVVGVVVSCERHPNADKLSLCIVDIGKGSNLQIICGAPNVRKGLKVAVATVGAVLPNNFKIKKAKLRGVESVGMICSEVEIGLSDEHEGIMELDSSAPLGENLRCFLDLDENIIEFDLTPNRGDCFSVLGVAREVCAIYDLALPKREYRAKVTGRRTFNSTISSPKACPKYLTRIIEGIDTAAKTPQWMAQRLLRSSQQLHSPVVDITNYVLLELGQPMHAFDLKKINGNINVRMAKDGEKIELLNEQTVALRGDTLVISDQHSAIAIAGVMGGISTATEDDSTEILLESAFFDPISIFGVARSYSLHTESSLRFERGVDYELTHRAMERATELVLEICGGKASEINQCIDASSLPTIEQINITSEKISRVLGFELDPAWIESKFKSLHFDTISHGNSSWTIDPPSFRFDIRLQADLIEELVRLYGYDKVPVHNLSSTVNISSANQTQITSHDISHSLVNRGYQEVITYSFISNEYHDLINLDSVKIKLKNPISDDMSIMRSSLWPGLLQTVQTNQRRGYNNARFFESGLCFKGVSVDQQEQKIAGIVCGQRYDLQWGSTERNVDFFDLKSDVESLLNLSAKGYQFEAAEHPALQVGQTAKISNQGKVIGWAGALSPLIQKKLSLPSVFLFELNQIDIQDKEISTFKPYSAYQASHRDIAVVVGKDVNAEQLINSINSLKQNYLIDVKLFDVYEDENIGKDRKSMALNLIYQSSDITLTDDQLNQQVNEVVAHLVSKFSAKLRE